MDTADNGSFVLAVESQGRRDPDKPASWAYYLSHLYAKYRTPPVLLVVRPDRSTAAWAARQVDIGPPQWPSLTLRPLVLGPDDLPVINSPEEAARDIPLTVLSAALKDLLADGENTAGILIELTEQGLGKTPAADLWRYLMAADLSFFQSQTAQNLRAEGRAEDVLLLLDRRGGRGLRGGSGADRRLYRSRHVERLVRAGHHGDLDGRAVRADRGRGRARGLSPTRRTGPFAHGRRTRSTRGVARPPGT